MIYGTTVPKFFQTIDQCLSVLQRIPTCRAGNGSMRTHKAAQLRAVMIRTHEKLALIFVTAWIAGSRLGRGCQSLKIEFVSVPFSVYLRHYIFVVVIPRNKT